MMVLSQVTRSNTSSLTVNDLSRLRWSIVLIRWVILRIGISLVCLLILHFLLVLISWWSGICEVGRSGYTWRTDIVRTTILSRNGGQMRDWVKVDGGTSGRADLIIGRMVLALLFRVERGRSLIVQCSLSSVTILPNVRVSRTGVEDHALYCQFGLLC